MIFHEKQKRYSYLPDGCPIEVSDQFPFGSWLKTLPTLDNPLSMLDMKPKKSTVPSDCALLFATGGATGAWTSPAVAATESPIFSFGVLERDCIARTGNALHSRPWCAGMLARTHLGHVAHQHVEQLLFSQRML